MSTLFAILSLIRVYTICHSQQSYQGLHYLPFFPLSRSTLFAILRSLIRVYTICHSQQSDQGLNCLLLSALWSGTTLFAILSLIRVYSFCHYQQSDQGLHSFPFILSSIIKVYTVCHFSSLIRATLLAILSSLIKVKVYTVILRKQSDQGLHYLPCSAIWSGSTLFAILSSLIKVKVYTVILRNSLIRVYTICHSQ